MSATIKTQQGFIEMLKTSCMKRIKKLKKEQLEKLAETLGVNVNKQKMSIMVDNINTELQKMESDGIMEVLRHTDTGVEMEVKELLANDIEIGEIIESGICARLDKFLEAEPNIAKGFVNVCDLMIGNDKKETVTSNNCVGKKVQGLYMLTIEKDGISHIVKMGSFAETQGMKSRITSFGGGCHDTGSATNKWFQRFMKKALNDGYTGRFVYYENVEQTKIQTTDLDGNTITMMPYVMRPKETQLFNKYNRFNNNIPPIFGSNCT